MINNSFTSSCLSVCFRLLELYSADIFFSSTSFVCVTCMILSNFSVSATAVTILFTKLENMAIQSTGKTVPKDVYMHNLIHHAH